MGTNFDEVQYIVFHTGTIEDVVLENENCNFYVSRETKL